MKEVNRTMIILARESRGWAQKELGERMGMSAANLSKIERGEIGINDKIVEAISIATDYPIQFFYQNGGIVSENLAYRKRRIVPQKFITSVDAMGNVLRQQVQFLTRILNTGKAELPQWEVSEALSPQKIAAKLRSKWEADNIRETILLRLVEQHGIPVMAFDFETDRIDSFSMLTDDAYPIIFINKRLLGDRRRFTIAYELGQLVMHTNKAIAPERDIKDEANLFAAELLMPEKEIRKDFEVSITVPVLAMLKKKWKVSMIALLYRADDLGYLSANQKKYLLEQFNRLGIRKREPQEYDLPIEQPHLVKKWISQYRQKTKLSLTETAATLCMNVDEYLERYG